VLGNFSKFLAVFTSSCAARPFTLILQNKGKNEGKKPILKVTKQLCFQVFSTDFTNGNQGCQEKSGGLRQKEQVWNPT